MKTLFDYETLTNDEIYTFDENIPPKWADRITLDTIRSGDLFGKKFSGITKFKFKNSCMAEYDAEFFVHDITKQVSCEWNSVVSISHERYSDKFVVNLLQS